ncbi:ComEA family DNA-binding protein [Gemmata sp.]|uniref:ComEA family DNA-binding protein n=1 Tax=Gemmata sp. TaxID=1914242 RepID=UPI003F6E8DBC
MDAQPPPPVPTPPVAASQQRSAQVALGVFLAVTLGLLAFRGYGSWLGARPTDPAPVALLDLNRADRAELEQVPGLGPALAREIADDRQKRGAFRSVEELRRVKGVGPATLEKVRAFVRVEAAAFPPDVVPATGEPLVLERRPAPVVPAPYPRAAGAGRKLQPGDPPVNVNTATAEQLMQLPGIGPVTAQNIVAARAERPFRSAADLDRVKGIGPKTLDKIRPFVAVE